GVEAGGRWPAPPPEQPGAGSDDRQPHDHAADGGEDPCDHPHHALSPSRNASRAAGAVRSSTAQVAPAARSASGVNPPVATPSEAAPMATAAPTSSGVSPTTTTRQRSSGWASRSAPRAGPVRSTPGRSPGAPRKPPAGEQ